MDKSLFERYAGIFILVVVGITVVMLGRAQQNKSSASVGSVQTEVAVAQPDDGATTSEGSEVVVDTVSAEPPLIADISQVPVLQDNSLKPVLNPETRLGKKPDHNLQTYVVQRGDTPGGIAKSFGLQPESILGGNPFLSEESSLLQVDTELIIMPVDGVLHTVQPGDTLEGLSRKYSISIEDIVAYEPNNLEFPYRLYPETQIVIPGAVRELFVWTPPQLPNASSGYWAGQAVPIVQGTGTFVWPVSSRRLTQNYWYGHQAIDVAVPEGTAVYASDTGTITYASWSPYCFGNLIVVNHGNGYESFYAHLNGFNVVPGQIVYQGSVIGYSGNTGCSSGPHLHLEIRINNNRDDPLWYLP